MFGVEYRSGSVRQIARAGGGDEEQFWGLVGRRLSDDGFAVLRSADAGAAALVAAASRLGDTQCHLRSGPDGVVEISPAAAAPRPGADRRDFVGTTAGVFKPHTDGTYLDQVVPEGPRFRRVGPPAAVLLQCVRPASGGGENVLVDGRRVFRDLVVGRPDLARILCRPGCVSYARDRDAAAGRAAFEPTGRGRWRVRFRRDRTALLPAWSAGAVGLLEEDYTLNPAYATRVVLGPGDILVVDNFRMLHGRTAIEEAAGAPPRLLRRLWVGADGAEFLSRAEGGLAAAAAATPHPYRLIPSPVPLHRRVRPRWGIRPDGETAAALARVAGAF